jgi:hypothetical protein
VGVKMQLVVDAYSRQYRTDGFPRLPPEGGRGDRSHPPKYTDLGQYSSVARAALRVIAQSHGDSESWHTT